MKKFKTLLATLLALSIPVSAASLAACNSGNDDAHKCGHVCTTCNKCTSDCTDEVCKDKCEGHEAASTVKITDGVYQRVLQGTRIHKIKLYEDNTFYFESAMGDANKGTYEIKEESITYASYKDEDGTVPDDAQWVTVTTKVVYFKNADGTPFTVNYSSQSADVAPSKSVVNGVADTGYKYGTPSNALALIDGKLINAKLGTYTRTLVQVPSIEFGIDDEMEIEQQKLMVKELPSGAPAGKTVQDYYISISQNGFKSYITGEEVLGSYTYANNVYTLSNTITGESFGTLTIGTDGAATYRNGNTTIELETWAEAQHTAVATLTGTKVINSQGQDNTVTFTLTLYDNDTCVLTNSMSDQLNVTGTWTKTNNNYNLTLTGWTVTSAAVSGENLTVVCGGSLGSATITDLSLTGKIASTTTPEVTEKLAKDMTATINGNELQGKVTFNSDGTVVISVPTVGLNVTGHYTAVSGQGLTVTDIGEMTLTQSGLSLVLGGTASVGGKSAPISATITCTQAELAGLMSNPAVTEKLAKNMTASINGNELQGKVTFNSDGTVVISVPTVGLKVTGHYTAVSGQGLTVTDIGDMTLTQSGLSLVLGGTASVGGKSAPISATISCTQAELVALMS